MENATLPGAVYRLRSCKTGVNDSRKKSKFCEFFNEFLECLLRRHWLRFPLSRMARNFRGCGPPRRRSNLLFILVVAICLMLFIILYGFNASQLPREEKMEKNIAELQNRLQHLESLYRARSEDILKIQNKIFARNNISNTITKTNSTKKKFTPEIVMLLKNMTGMKASTGVQTKVLTTMENSFILKLLPHLMNDPHSLRPAYHLRSHRHHFEIVIGIPTVKRDKESYLLVTLMHLIDQLNEKDKNDTLIIILAGETDLEYVLNVAKEIETEFHKQVQNGMIEVISPSQGYYPEFDDLPLTLGDSLKRVKWRSKQNLDTIYLMAYAQTRGTYYLMLEDDVIAEENYMQEIKQFVNAMSVSTPNWFILEFCHVGGIGKLFRSSDLINFIVYVQLFYQNMPIDWLMESYLADRVCTINKSSDPRFGTLPLYYPHKNPPIKFVRVTIKEKPDHTFKRAYEGKTFFWGLTPKKGEVIEFWFSEPTNISSYTFRSGNVKHKTDKFFDTVVEIYTERDKKFTIVDRFDEFGLADGRLDSSDGPLLAIRLRVVKDSFYCAVLSEIELNTTLNKKRSARQIKKIRRPMDGFLKPFRKPFKKALM